MNKKLSRKHQFFKAKKKRFKIKTYQNTYGLGICTVGYSLYFLPPEDCLGVYHPRLKVIKSAGTGGRPPHWDGMGHGVHTDLQHDYRGWGGGWQNAWRQVPALGSQGGGETMFSGVAIHPTNPYQHPSYPLTIQPYLPEVRPPWGEQSAGGIFLNVP